MSTVNIVSLGGVQETGKNLYVVEVDNDIFILDAGMKYPPSDVFGVDIVLPDISYLITNAKRIKGIFLTHAHDDHIAAIPHILKYMKIPVYASLFTLSVVKELMQEHNLNPNNYELIAVSEKVVLRFGYVSVRFINVSHSVPQSMAIVINTPDGNVLYTGNYNFDQNGKSLYRTNIDKICKVASEGVLALMPECIATINEINRGSIAEFVQRSTFLYIHFRLSFFLMYHREKQQFDCLLLYEYLILFLVSFQQHFQTQANCFLENLYAHLYEQMAYIINQYIYPYRMHVEL
jgi:ribonuclease J